MSNTFIDQFIAQQARLRECLQQGIEVGPAGRFYVAVCKEILARADEAAANQNLTLMLRSFNEMKEFQE